MNDPTDLPPISLAPNHPDSLLARIEELERADRERAARMVELADALTGVASNAVDSAQILSSLIEELVARGVLPDNQ